MKRTPLRRNTPLARTRKKPSRIGRLPDDVRAAVMERSGGRCELSSDVKPGWISGTWRCNQEANQVAHRHGLKMGGNRSKRDATCPVCDTRLNDPSNLLHVCSIGHNNAVAIPCPGRG